MCRALLLGLIWGLSHGCLAQYCVEQPYEKESFTGEDITFPCSFTYMETKSNFSSVTSVVRAGPDYYCNPGYNEIYSSSNNYTSPQYTGRLSVQLDPAARKSSLTIRNLTSEDGQRYCCRYRIDFLTGESSAWQHPDGTFIRVKDEKEMILEQEYLILALSGDTVTIAVRFKLKNQIMTHNVTDCGVFKSTYYYGCGDKKYPVTCTQRMGDNLVYFKINNTDDSDNGNYCYSLNVSGGGSNYTGRTNIGSQLLVHERSNASKIRQTTEVEIWRPNQTKSGVIINCSFSIQDMTGDRPSLWSQVYWMVGEPRENYIYHPNPDYIDPDYRGRTKLIGQSDLLLEDFPGPDNSTLYCRVAVRFCLASQSEPNRINSVLEEGPGTLIRVHNISGRSDELPPSDLPTIIIASSVGCAVLLLLVLVVICLKTIKVKKRSNSGETIVETVDANVSQNSAYANIEEFQKPETTPDEKVLYATVNHSAKTAKKKPPVLEEPEVVYAAVKK